MKKKHIATMIMSALVLIGSPLYGEWENQWTEPTQVCAATKKKVKKWEIEVERIIYELSSDYTARVKNVSRDYDKTKVVIPKSVVYKNRRYTVKAVEIYEDEVSDTYCYHGIKQVVIPATVTEEVSIFGGAVWDNEDPLVFKDLEKITFLGKVPPKEIYVSCGNSSKYSDKQKTMDLVVEVPKGSVGKYKKKMAKVVRHDVDCSDCAEGRNIKLTANVVKAGTKNVEPRLFQSGNCVYQVKKSAKSGIGKVILWRMNENGFRQGEIPGVVQLNSTVKYGTYTYKVDEIAKDVLSTCCAFHTLVIPDTVTTLQEGSIPAVDAVFLSKNCTSLPSKMFYEEQNEDEEKNEKTLKKVGLVYAPGVTTIQKDTFSGVEEVKELVLKNGTTLPEENSKIKEVVYTEPITNGANLTAPASIELRIKDKPMELGAGFVSASTEQIRYIMTSNSRADGVEPVQMSPEGLLEPKASGEAYMMAYSPESGKYVHTKVTVQDITFKEGIYTYKTIYNSEHKDAVEIVKCVPTEDMETLTLPSEVTVENVKYVVTGMWPERDPKTMDDKHYDEVFDSGFVIDLSVAKKSKITKIIVPSTMTGKVSLYAKLPKLTEIRFEGTTAPKKIYFYAGKEIGDVKLYVPQASYVGYKTAVNGVAFDGTLEDDDYRIKFCLETYE